MDFEVGPLPLRSEGPVSEARALAATRPNSDGARGVKIYLKCNTGLTTDARRRRARSTEHAMRRNPETDESDPVLSTSKEIVDEEIAHGHVSREQFFAFLRT
jgi:hypothetical protein